jgi:hypothetical protein
MGGQFLLVLRCRVVVQGDRSERSSRMAVQDEKRLV